MENEMDDEIEYGDDDSDDDQKLTSDDSDDEDKTLKTNQMMWKILYYLNTK
jgi:hypothetical protein